MLSPGLISLGLFAWQLKSAGARQLPCPFVRLCRGAGDRLITFQYFSFLKRMVSQGVYLSRVSRSLVHFVPRDESKWRLVDKIVFFMWAELRQFQASPFLRCVRVKLLPSETFEAGGELA